MLRFHRHLWFHLCRADAEGLCPMCRLAMCLLSYSPCSFMG